MVFEKAFFLNLIGIGFKRDCYKTKTPISWIYGDNLQKGACHEN